MSGKQVVPADEFIAKIKAGVDARKDQDFTVLARTDAIAVHGLNEAVGRARSVRVPRTTSGTAIA